jgi:hypothetical protein
MRQFRFGNALPPMSLPGRELIFMNHSTLPLVLALTTLCSPLLLPASAQESAVSPISTERPTSGYSPDVIPGGSLQVENGTGLNLQRRQFTADLPENFLRVGFFDRFEVRYQASNLLYSSQVAPGSSQWQTADTQVSGKLLVGRPNGLLPRSAVLSLNIPTGAPAQTSGSYDPGTALIWTQSLPHGWSLNEDAIATLTTLNHARRPTWAPSVLAGKALNEKVSLFAECAPVVMQNDSRVWLVDGGFAILRRATQQIDFRSGYLKDNAGIHTLLSVGFSIRRNNLFKPFRSVPITR